MKTKSILAIFAVLIMAPIVLANGISDSNATIQEAAPRLYIENATATYDIALNTTYTNLNFSANGSLQWTTIPLGAMVNTSGTIEVWLADNNTQYTLNTSNATSGNVTWNATEYGYIAENVTQNWTIRWNYDDMISSTQFAIKNGISVEYNVTDVDYAELASPSVYLRVALPGDTFKTRNVHLATGADRASYVARPSIDLTEVDSDSDGNWEYVDSATLEGFSTRWIKVMITSADDEIIPFVSSQQQQAQADAAIAAQQAVAGNLLVFTTPTGEINWPTILIWIVIVVAIIATIVIVITVM